MHSVSFAFCFVFGGCRDFLPCVHRHNAAYGEALALHGEGGPNSEEWKRAKKLYDTVISDR